jgi:hypothetical protein
MREGVATVSADNEYSCAQSHGAQINFDDLTPYLTNGRCKGVGNGLKTFACKRKERERIEQVQTDDKK